MLHCACGQVLILKMEDVTVCCKLKKFLKFIAILSAVVSAIVGVYFLITKFLEKKNAVDDPESYVSCSCCDEEPIILTDLPQV